MKKIFTNLVAVLFVATFSVSSALALDLKYGVSGALVSIKAEGNETETGSQTAETTPGSASNRFGIASIFAEAQFSDNITFGVDYVPFGADVSDSTLTRQDTETSVTGTATATTTVRDQTAQAEVSNHITIYGNYYVSEGLYLHLGYAMVDVKTQESLDTGSAYGDIDLTGIQYGVGLQMSDRFRLELAHTDYDSFDVTSSTARTGVTTNNKISGDIDTTQLKLSVLF
tara:strand:- start:2030 stop:2713 length:684 start_codon:yes stop_codon:yes gene_type:complete